MKYSVIIPAYNSEKTLERCLDSLVCQLRDDIEIFVINDGSADKTEAIAMSYQERYAHFHYIKKKNGGVSSARNLGLELATGEYITFLDSDDWVTPDFFVESDKSTVAKPDFVFFSYFDISSGRKYIKPNAQYDSQEEIIPVMAQLFRQESLNAVLFKLYKRKIIQAVNLRFPAMLHIGEDKAFLLGYIFCIQSAVFSDKIVYVVNTENQQSLSRRKREDLPQQLLQLHRAMTVSLNESELPKKLSDMFRKKIAWSYFRNIYVIAKEYQKFGYPVFQRWKQVNIVCKLYNQEKVRPIGFMCHLIALPQRMCFGWLIDTAVRIILKVRQ